MLADYVRTGTYQRAIVNNSADFAGKVVLDVGTGTGILAFFAAQAGAKKVYAVDASDAALVAQTLAQSNGYGSVIQVIKGKLEEIELPEKVDIIISEPIGFLLVHERMLETYLVARDKFLKPNGLMMPTTGTIFLTPFTDDALYRDHCARASFFENSSFYGIDFSAITAQAYREYFAQAIVGYVDTNSLLSPDRASHKVDFSTVTQAEMNDFTKELRFKIQKTANKPGVAGWFVIDLLGSQEPVVLTTAPEAPGTHWYQCRLLLLEPIAVNKGQIVTGKLHFIANQAFSYYVDMFVEIEGTEVKSSNRINLKDQVRTANKKNSSFVIPYFFFI
jgi:histone-arginine methyltransferase CARM1